MKISMIAAISSNGVIGNNNKIPWKIKSDMSLFKRHTINKPVIMGKNTFLSLNSALKQRHNIVLTSDDNFEKKYKDIYVAKSIEKALFIAKQLTKTQKYENSSHQNTAKNNINSIANGAQNEVMIIGGQKTYEQFIKLANKIYLSKIDKIFEGDSYFPKINPDEWKLVSSTYYTAQDGDEADFTFNIYNRINYK